MKNKILLYLLVFASLFAIFIYVNDKKILDDQTRTMEGLYAKIEKLENSRADTTEDISEGFYDFSLTTNEHAMTYYENRGLEADTIRQRVLDMLIEMNRANEDHQLVPYQGDNGPLRINKVKLLNHKWVIAEFTDGVQWGEIILKYEVSSDQEISFHPMDSFLY